MKRVMLMILTVVLLAIGGVVSAAPTGATVQTKHDPKLGTILAGAKGLTLYHFTKDTTPGKSACYEACAKAWPPLTTTGTPTLASGVPGELGTITRTDGTKQVTYNGLPLYYFAKDGDAGDTYGQGIGGVWFVVKPVAMGTPQASPAASPAASSAAQTSGKTAVAIKGFAFNPGSVSVAVGTTVTWTNQDSTAHTVTANDGSFDSGPVQPGSSFSHTFTKAGTVAYHCKIHPSMTATIIVK